MPNNANQILQKATPRQELVGDHLRDGADWFHQNEGELFERSEAIDSLRSELDVDEQTASAILAELAGDTVDPIVHIQADGSKHFGVIGFETFEGAYGYVDYDDVQGKRKRVVCAQCVQEKEVDTDVAHATAGDRAGQFADQPDADYGQLLEAVHDHYTGSHALPPSEVETGATLSSGTTIGGNTSWHAGNDGSGSGLDADTLDNYNSSDFLLDAGDSMSGELDMGGNNIRGAYDIYSQNGGRVLLRSEGSTGEVGMYDDSTSTWTVRQHNGGDLELDASGSVYSQSALYENGNRIATRTWSTSSFVDASGDSMSGRLSMGADDLYFQPSSAGGSVTGLTFESNTNAGSDYGYVEYHDDYFGDGTGESSALVLRTENDTTDEVVLDGAGGATIKGGDLNVNNSIYENSNRVATQTWSTSNFVDESGDTMSGSLDMGNNNLTGVNTVNISDPGDGEGIVWANWHISESPNDLTNNSGNFQVVHNGTRALTVNGSNALEVPHGSLTQGNNPADTITETTSPKGFDVAGDNGRDIHEQTDVTISNGTTSSVSETITVELYDGTDTTGTLLSSESKSVSVAAGSSSMTTFLTGDLELNNGTYHVNVTQSGTTLSVDQTDELTKGASYEVGQTNVGDLFLRNQDGSDVLTVDAISEDVNFPNSQLSEQGNRVATRFWATGSNILHSELADAPATAHHTKPGGGTGIVFDSTNNEFDANLGLNLTTDANNNIDVQQGGGSGLNADLLDGNHASDISVDVEEDGTVIVSDASAINFQGHLNVVDDTDGTVSLDPTHNHDSRYVTESGDTMSGALNMGGNDLHNTRQIDGSTGNHRIRFDSNSSWIEITDQSNNRNKLVTNDIYANGSWFSDHETNNSAHHSRYGDWEARTAVENGNVSHVQFSNIEDISDGQIGRDNSIGFLASWGNNGTGVLWDSYNVNAGNQINISGGTGQESNPTIAVNDGSSSGLDADTVDGSHAADLGVTVEDNGTVIYDPTTGINFGSNMSVTDDTDGTVTVDVSASSYSGWTFEEGDGESTTIGDSERAIVSGGSDITTELTGTAPATIQISHGNTGSAASILNANEVIYEIDTDSNGHLHTSFREARSLNDWDTPVDFDVSAASKMALPSVTADPTASAGDMWYRSDLD